MSEKLDAVGVFWAVLSAILAAWVIQWIVGLLLAGAVANHFAVELQKATTHLLPSIGSTKQAIDTPAPKQIIVPGRSIADCNALTGGVLNDQWNKCRNTHRETVTE